MKDLHILTKNTGKLIAAKKIFSKFDINLKMINREYPEIQAETSLEVAKFMAIQAAKELGVPVIREDHSLCLDALGGLPGPFISYFDKKLPAIELLKLLKNSKNRAGYFELSAVYADPSGKVKEYSYRIPIILATEEKGSRGNWNKIILLKNKPNKTLGESTEEENSDIWSSNYKKIANYINSL